MTNENVTSLNDPAFLLQRVEKVVKQADKISKNPTAYWSPFTPWQETKYHYPFIFDGTPHFSTTPHPEAIYPPPLPEYSRSDYKITMAATEIARILNHYCLVGEFVLISPTHSQQFHFFPPPPCWQVLKQSGSFFDKNHGIGFVDYRAGEKADGCDFMSEYGPDAVEEMESRASHVLDRLKLYAVHTIGEVHRTKRALAAYIDKWKAKREPIDIRDIHKMSEPERRWRKAWGIRKKVILCSTDGDEQSPDD